MNSSKKQPTYTKRKTEEVETSICKEYLAQLSQRDKYSAKLPKYDILKEHAKRGELKVIVFNVGQGEHILIQFEDGRYGIIDFYFEGGKGCALSEPPAITYLRNIPEKEPLKIAFICVTHTDYDHIKEIDESIEYLKKRPNTVIENIWTPGAEHIQDIMNEMTNSVDGFNDIYYGLHDKEEAQMVNATLYKLKKITEDKALKGIIRPIEGIDILTHEIENLRIDCLGPLNSHTDSFDKKNQRHLLRHIVRTHRLQKAEDKNISAKELEKLKQLEKKASKDSSADPNAISSILRFVYHRHQLLFTGDVTLKTWNECIKEFKRSQATYGMEDLEPNFVKAPHHGSEKNSSPDMWSDVFPKNGEVHVSFSAGLGRNYLHPKSKTYGDMDIAREKKENLMMFRRKTNKCFPCIENNCCSLLLTTDLFEFEKNKVLTEEEKKRLMTFKRLAKIDEIELHSVDSVDYEPGIMGLLYRFHEKNDRKVEFNIIISKGMKRYDSCLFGRSTEETEKDCPEPVKENDA